MKSNRSILVIAVSAGLLFAFQNCAKNAEVSIRPLDLYKASANVTYELPLTPQEINQIVPINPGDEVIGENPGSSSDTDSSTGTDVSGNPEATPETDPIYNGCNFKEILTDASAQVSDGRVRIFQVDETIQASSFSGDEIILLGQGENIVVNIEGVIDRPIFLCGLKIGQMTVQSCSMLENLNQASTTIEKLITDDSSADCESMAMSRQSLTIPVEGISGSQTVSQTSTGISIEPLPMETPVEVVVAGGTSSQTETATQTQSDLADDKPPGLIDVFVDKVLNNPIVQAIASWFKIGRG